MERKSLSEFIDSQDNVMLSADGQWVLIVQWVDGKASPVAQCHLDNFFDGDGNYFERDI